MKCPKCDCKKTHTTNTLHRTQFGDSVVRRYRKCCNCGYKFPTYECYEVANIEATFSVSQVKPIIQQAMQILNVRG